MRLAFPSLFLPLWAISAFAATAQEPAENEPAQEAPAKEEPAQTEPAQEEPAKEEPAQTEPAQEEPSKEEQPQEDKLLQMLDDMAKTQDDDFFAAASFVLEQTGDELAFHTRMKELAEQGHPVAAFWLAKSLRSGESPYQDEEVAAFFRNLVMQAADKDYLPAVVQAAQALYYGGETNEEKAQGLEMMVSACKKGSAKARACYLIMTGLLTDKDSDLETPEIATELKHHNFYVDELVAEAHWEDMNWLKVAAEHGSAWAAYELSLRGHLKNRESLAYLRMAAERHMPEAMTTLGCLLCLGPLPADHAPQSLSSLPEKARPMSEAPPESENATSAQGEGVNMSPSAESIAEGIQLLRRATAMGDERAAAFTALAYAAGMAGDVSAERVAALFNYAHERELPYGTTGWGYCLASGKGCGQNTPLGLELLEQMAKQGVSWAYLALSHLYKDGTGVEKNDTKAAEYRKEFDEHADFSPFVPTEPDAPFFPALK